MVLSWGASFSCTRFTWHQGSEEWVLVVAATSDRPRTKRNTRHINCLPVCPGESWICYSLHSTAMSSSSAVRASLQLWNPSPQSYLSFLPIQPWFWASLPVRTPLSLTSRYVSRVFLPHLYLDLPHSLSLCSLL